MKKLLFILALLLPSPALAGVSCSVPFNLQNGTVADASQVMANYNALIACLANAAAAGSNNDITALLGITTPLAPSEGGTPLFYGGTSTGSGNAQVVATTVPNSFALTNGYTVVFTAGFSNTGTTTLNVNSTGPKNIFKIQSSGIVALASGDIVAGQIVMATYDGTEFQINTTTPLLSRSATSQSFSGGISITTFNNGTISGGGTLTVNCGLGPLQTFTNNGAFTFAADSNDGSCDFLMFNAAGAGAVSFSGFIVSANTGDALTTVNNNKFILHAERIQGVATYMIKALQ